jgi:hypothetical protein
MGRLIIAGLIAALTLGSFVLVASAQVTPPPPSQPRAPFWPDIKGAPVVAEWYSDVPWHQKLGTSAGNEIDEALVLPYDALGANEQLYCTNNKLSPEDCMIETGINSILGIYRTDTFYDPTDTKITAARRCQTNSLTPPCATTPLCLVSQPCMEVKLALAMFWTRSDAAGSVLQLQPRPFGNDLQADPNYGGYVITDGTTYAPQMPWYMSHYCDSQFTSAGDALDPVCYADYFTSMNDGFNLLPTKAPTAWPDSVPWSVFPTADAGRNHCQPGLTTCTLVMAGFDLMPVPPILTNLQYYTYNNNLLTWFNGALANFPNNFTTADLQRHFPWSGTQVTWGDGSPTDLYPQAVLNPFLGQFTFTNNGTGGTPNCTVTLTGPVPSNCTTTAIDRADHYPRDSALSPIWPGRT